MKKVQIQFSHHTELSSSPISSPFYELKKPGTNFFDALQLFIKNIIISTTHNPYLKTLNYASYTEETQAKTIAEGKKYILK